MGGGGKGGGSTTQIKLPPAIEKAAKENLKIADETAAVGYVPYSGPTQAAFSPMQMAAFGNTAGAANAFGMGGPTGAGPGLNPITGLPAPEQFAGGLMGYRPNAVYEQAKANIAPGQRAMLDSFFMDPMTGAQALNPVVPGHKFSGAGPGFRAPTPAPVRRPPPAPRRHQFADN